MNMYTHTMTLERTGGLGAFINRRKLLALKQIYNARKNKNITNWNSSVSHAVKMKKRGAQSPRGPFSFFKETVKTMVVDTKNKDSGFCWLLGSLGPGLSHIPAVGRYW